MVITRIVTINWRCSIEETKTGYREFSKNPRIITASSWCCAPGQVLCCLG